MQTDIIDCDELSEKIVRHFSNVVWGIDIAGHLNTSVLSFSPCCYQAAPKYRKTIVK